MTSHRRTLASRRHSRGMTLIELMVAITVGLFLLLAMYAIFVSFKLTSQSQNGLAQMQDDQRMSMTILSQIAQSAGYFGNVQTQLVNTALLADNSTVSGVSFSAGQALFGTDSGSATAPDTLYIRFQSLQNDGVLNCLGNTNTASAGTVTYINQLAVASSTLQLTCGINGAAAQPIVGGLASPVTTCPSIGYRGISNIQFLYGVDPGNTGSVTQYVTAGSVTNWLNVRSLRATLSMQYCGQIGAAPVTISFPRFIFLPNQI